MVYEINAKNDGIDCEKIESELENKLGEHKMLSKKEKILFSLMIPLSAIYGYQVGTDLYDLFEYLSR